MSIKYLIFIITFIINLYDIQSQNIKSNETFSSTQIPQKEFEAIFRIDSLYNNYTLTKEEDNIMFIEQKIGKKQYFLITSTFYNSYFIISKDGNRRLGIDEENSLHLYKSDENINIEKTYWNIIKYDKQPNIYLIQNVYNKKFLQIKPNNNKLRCKIAIEYDPINKIDSSTNEVKFLFSKLYEEVEIRPIDIEMVNKEPIDILMKYIDYSDKTLKIPGKNEKRRDYDIEELKYSIRSIFKYIPWIRKIFIVMPNKKVRFFKPIEEIKEKIVYVNQTELISLETSNSAPIQLCLFKLKKYGISDNFIYMDDNYFIGGHLKKTDFFYYDDMSKKVLPSIVNKEIIELDKKNILKAYNESSIQNINAYDNSGWHFSVLSSQKLLIDNYDIPLLNVEFTHNALPLNFYDLKEIHELVINNYKYAKETLFSVERNIYNLQPQILFALYGLNIKKRKVHTIEYNYFGLEQIEIKYLYSKLVGINMGGYAYTPQHEKAKKILAERYSEPIKYEIGFEEKKVVKEEEQSTYINKTELKIIEDIFKSQLNYCIIIYWGLIILISVVLVVIIFYFLELNKKSNFCKKYRYNRIKQEDT